MIYVEAIEFAIGGQVDTCLLLDVEDNAGCIQSGLLTGEGGKPIGNWIGPNCSS